MARDKSTVDLVRAQVVPFGAGGLYTGSGKKKNATASIYYCYYFGCINLVI